MKKESLENINNREKQVKIQRKKIIDRIAKLESMRKDHIEFDVEKENAEYEKFKVGCEMEDKLYKEIDKLLEPERNSIKFVIPISKNNPAGTYSIHEGVTIYLGNMYQHAKHLTKAQLTEWILYTMIHEEMHRILQTHIGKEANHAVDCIFMDNYILNAHGLFPILSTHELTLRRVE